jgi:acid phosphatase
VSAYFASGKYEREVSDIVGHLRRLIQARLARAPTDNERQLVIVWDIDETIVSTSDHTREDYMRRHAKALRRMRKPSADGQGSGAVPKPRHPIDDYYPPIPGMVEFYNEVLAMGVRGVLLTGRYDDVRDLTEGNLEWAGVRGWDQLIMREPHEVDMTASEYKLRRRQALARVYDIVASVGDQQSDMAGEHCGYKVRMPNPEYHIE